MVREMTDAERWRALGMLDAGMSLRAVGRHFGRSHTTIARLVKKTRARGTVSHAGTGAARHTTPRADRRLLRMVRGNPTLPATLLRLMWHERSRRGNILSAGTIRNRLREQGLRSRKMRKRPRLSPAHVSRREQWAMQRVHWRMQQWRRVVFTDESRFRLYRNDGRIRVWRMPRQEMLQQHVQRTQQQGASLHVWAGITLTGKTELVVLNRNVTGERYAELLESHLLPFMTQIYGDTANWILQDDNAAPHRAAVVARLKEHLGIRTLRWPARSPDMNPIEHVWDYLKRQVQQRDPPPQTLRELRDSVVDVWQQTPQDFLRRLVLGMPRRISALLHARGGYTRY